MSGKSELDLNTILREFHAEERRAAARAAAEARPQPAPQSREVVREAAPAPRPREVIREAAPAPQPREVVREAAPAPRPREIVREAAPAPRPVAAARVEEAPEPEPFPAHAILTPSRKTDTADWERLNPPPDFQAMELRRSGIARMIAVLAALALLLGGLLFWVIRDEKQAVADEPQAISLELGEALESYLEEAPTRTHG